MKHLDIMNNYQHDQIINLISDSDSQLNDSDQNSSRVKSSEGLNQFQNLRNSHEYNPQINSSHPNDAFFSTSPELAEIFTLISTFKPAPLELTSHFKPFLPELSPTIGAIDAFIKIPKPDGEQDFLGLMILDEPSIGCSDPQIYRMKLREHYGLTSDDQADGYIGFIEDPKDNSKALVSFLENYEEISKNRAPSNMIYSYKMPDISNLMEEWPESLIDCFETIPLPTGEIDLSCEDYFRVICAILDIPLQGNIIESLHFLFSLYQEFAKNPYFDQSRTGTSNLCESLK